MSTVSDLSVPEIPPLSPSSSVSSRLQDEYDELLKFAVVVPKYDPRQLPQTLTDVRESFLQAGSQSRRTERRQMDEDEMSDATDVTPINAQRSPQERLPDYTCQTLPRERLPDFTCQTSPRERLPDFGGHSPIIDGERPHDPIPSHYFARVPSNKNLNGNNYQEVDGDYQRVYTATVDPDISKMENMMDQWCLDLKRNVLAEFSQSKIQIVEKGRLQLVKEQEKHASEKMKLVDEINSLKELLATYEKSITRKDQVISNLTHALQKQKDKTEMMRTFCEWRMKHNDFKRETFCTMIAKKHHERCLQRKVWDAWHSVIETKWRVRVEKACQAKAQEVCLQLTNDYEARLAAANEELESVRAEVVLMHRERDRYEEVMKKAFMRGVCALNLEAMTIFHSSEEKENIGNGHIADDISENMQGSMPEKDYSIPKTFLHDTMHHERIVTSEGSRPSVVVQSQSKSTTTKAAGKPGTMKALTTKVTSKVDSRKSKGLGSHVLAPPMSSVTVERHQPITKQTMSHAVAEKYPRAHTAPSSGLNRKLAGQGHLPSNIQTVKHVE